VDLVVDDRGLLHVAFVDETGTPHLARPNTAPVAGPDSFTTYVNTRLRGNVLADDTDAEGDRLRIETSPHRTPRHGRVTLQANGRFTYVPNMGFNGTDGFRYELLEEGGRSAIGDVAIAVEVPVLIRAVSTPLADQRKSSRIRTSLRSPSLPLMTAVLQRRVRADWNDVREGPAARLTQLARPVQQEWSKGHYRVELRHVDRGYPLARSEEFQMPARRGTDLLLRGDLTSLPNVEPRLTTPKRPARSASEPTPKPKPKPTATPKPPTFDPARAKWGLWPLNASKPQLRRGAKGDAVRYVQGVIAHNAGGNIAVDGDYGMQTWYRVQQVQVFFGLVVDGKVGPETWLVIDELATS
jgi:hypothetical protein